jgi:tetratricopeptide (TPR) repeat protein
MTHQFFYPSRNPLSRSRCIKRQTACLAGLFLLGTQLLSISCTHTRKDAGNDNFYVVKGAKKGHHNPPPIEDQSKSKNLSTDINKTITDQASGKTKPISKITEASYWEEENPEAAKLQEKAKQNPQDTATLLELAAYYHEKLLFDKAYEIYLQLLKLSPENIRALEGLGRLMRDINQPQLALEHLKKCLEIAPDNVSAWNTLGTVYMHQGDFSRAADSYEKALSLNPDAAYVQSNLCFALSRAGKFIEAIVHGEKAVQLNPDFPVAQNNLGIAYAMAGNPQVALQHFKLGSHSSEAGALNNLGLVYLNGERYEEAMRYFLAAAKLNPNDPSASKNYYRAKDLKTKAELRIKKYYSERAQDPLFWEQLRSTLKALQDFPCVNSGSWPELELPIVLSEGVLAIQALPGTQHQSSDSMLKVQIVSKDQWQIETELFAGFLEARKYQISLKFQDLPTASGRIKILYRSGLSEKAVELAHQIPKNQDVRQSDQVPPGVDMQILLTEQSLPEIRKLNIQAEGSQ